MNNFNILLVEDNAIDQKFAKKALEEAAINANIDVVNDGQEAWEYLQEKGAPTVIISDLNMPRVCGKELLKKIKSDENYKTIPVIIFSTSSSHWDVKDCYSSNANAYLVKPDNIQDYSRVFSSLKSFWVDEAKLVQ